MCWPISELGGKARGRGREREKGGKVVFFFLHYILLITHVHRGRHAMCMYVVLYVIRVFDGLIDKRPLVVSVVVVVK